MNDGGRSHERISQITTMWTQLLRMHAGPSSVVGPAQQKLLERYSSAVYRYLIGSLRDSNAADDLFQEFAVRLVRGDFKRADRDRGRFRDFLKAALRNLMIDYQRRQARAGKPLSAEEPEAPGGAPPFAEDDRLFTSLWKDQVIEQAWGELLRCEAESGKRLHTVLRLRADLPDLSVAELAARLSERLAEPVTEKWATKRLNQAREKFRELVLDQLAMGLDDPTPDALEEELIDLGLWEKCHTALDKRRGLDRTG